GLNRPDVAEALARQREHRKGTWVARGLMVPALLFGLSTLSIPLGFLYFGLLETGVALLIVPGLIFLGLASVVDRNLQNPAKHASQPLFLTSAGFLLVPLLGVVATLHIAIALYPVNDAYAFPFLSGAAVLAIGVGSQWGFLQPLWRLIAGLMAPVGGFVVLWCALGQASVMFAGGSFDYVDQNTLRMHMQWVLIAALPVLAGLMLLERRWPRAWTLRDGTAVFLLVAACVGAGGGFGWLPWCQLLVPAGVFVLARLWRGQALQVLALIAFIAVLIAAYRQAEVSFVIKAGLFALLAIGLAVGAAVVGRRVAIEKQQQGADGS
ncbi:MAG: hypothetical protein VXX01_02200, partial [Pseudomonadota bacterium]|nr:hypothetical protein [Pseudomonadota bacterium]